MYFNLKYPRRFLILTVLASGISAYAANAKPSDLAQADKFLAELPAVCAASSRSVGSDGSINIRIKCDGNGKKIDGLVAIKNGIVTKIR